MLERLAENTMALRLEVFLHSPLYIDEHKKQHFMTLTDGYEAFYYHVMKKKKMQASPPKLAGLWLNQGFGALIAVITFLIYLPSLRNGFVNWDDNIYVYENLNIHSFGLPLFWWSLTAVVAALWHPLTLVSFALDHAIWGLDPSGYHLTSNIFHTINTYLVFILGNQLCEHSGFMANKPKSAIMAGTVTALLFGIHPLHVESVAWVSERKDVLCAFFYLLSLITYLKYTSSSSTKRTIFYRASLSFFIMALMSKPMAISLPIALLILDFYPVKGLWIEVSDIKRVLIEKIPFFVLSLLSSFITVWAHRIGGSFASLEALPLIERIFIAMRAFIFYLFKMLLPNNLAPLYPLSVRINYFNSEYILAFILTLLITFFCLWSLNRTRLYLAIWLYYVVTLIPVIGLVQVGSQAVADRYTYLPSIGPFFLSGLGMAVFLEKYSARRYRFLIISIFLLLSSILGIKTIRQISIWKDPITLWSHEISIFPSVDKAHYNRGLAYKNKGQYDRAIEDYDKAVALNPNYADAFVNRGLAYANRRQDDRAIEDYSKAIALNPTNVHAYYNRGISNYNKGQHDRAIEDFDKAISLDPAAPKIYNNRGIAYANKGEYDRAIDDFDKAITLDPNAPKVYNNRGIAYANKGEYDRAISNFKKACDMGDIEGCEVLRRLRVKRF